MNRTHILFLLLACLSICAVGQPVKSARQIYDASSPSVFLIHSNDQSGNPNKYTYGSGFEVAPRTIATNAHVVAGGSPLILIGASRIPAHILNIDSINDLAVITVDTDLPASSAPLTLSTEQPSPGDRIFAIGNPEQLQNTISDGIVSAIRSDDDGLSVVQVTSPVSHGSSGGPIFNEHGEVIAVTVRTRDDGQNLNFAVPINYLRTLLKAKPGTVTSSLTPAAFYELLAAYEKESFSTVPGSPFQTRLNDIRAAIRLVTSKTNNYPLLSQFMCLAYNHAPDLAGDALADTARQVITMGPASDGEAHAVLAYELSFEAENHLSADATHAEQEGMTEAAQSIKIGGRGSATAEYANGVLLYGQKRPEGTQVLQKVLTESPDLFACGTALRSYTYTHLIDFADKSGSYDEAENYFKDLVASGEVSVGDWERESVRRTAHKDYLEAAVASEKVEFSYPIRACDAALHYSSAKGDYADKILAESKKCFDVHTKTGAVIGENFNLTLSTLHRVSATILNNRGTYTEALVEAQLGTTLNPKNPRAFYEQARALEKLGRSKECIAAAQQAVTLSGDDSLENNFELGSCYYDAEKWKEAAASFRIAAKNASDANAAYRLAQTLKRQGNSAEAQGWFQEALKRGPDEQLKAQIVAAEK